MERLQGKKVFSKFDIRWGYNNVRLAEGDRWKAAFKTPYGTYLPNVMYFGLKNAPAFFTRLMRRDFGDWLDRWAEYTVNYLDDFGIATGDSPEQLEIHEQCINELLMLMQKKSYFLKPKKCQFMVWKLTMLGWDIDEGKMKIEASKVRGIMDWPREIKDVHEVHKVMGVLSYNRAFI